jgi:AcrR family transcriptional regulator
MRRVAKRGTPSPFRVRVRPMPTRPSQRARRRPEPAPLPGRLPPDERRRQLLDEAARILTEHGIAELQITAVAARADVSRPLVYRLFPTRQALVRNLLQDVATLVQERFHEALLRSMPSTVEGITRAFVEASCDAIDARGAGPWRMLVDARGADPEIGRMGREIFAALLDPWQGQLAAFLHTTPRRAKSCLWVIVAAGRAALDGWIDGALTRAEAMRDATTAIAALLVAFASSSDKPAERSPRA